MKKLIKGLREFKTSYFCTHQDLFEQLAHGQKPRVLFITCSDSRVDPNLITQADLGELFVIRNAGNIIPPYGATNGGEGATIEYALQALDIRQVVICGHSHCGAMKGLMKLNKISSEMPLVRDWLKYSEATRRMVTENYSHYDTEELLEIMVAENVLTQIDNLRTYPVVRSKMYRGELNIYAWVYSIETGEMLAYDPERHAYVLPQTQLPPSEIDETILAPVPVCDIPSPSHLPEQSASSQPTSPRLEPTVKANHQDGHRDFSHKFPVTPLSREQAQRIYRGSSQ